MIITTLTPSLCRALTVSADSGRISSARRSAAATCPSSSTCKMMAPSVRHCAATASSRLPRASSSAGPPTCTRVSATCALTPSAGSEVNPLAAGISRPRCLAAATMARASGCSLSVSAAAARASTASPSWTGAASMPVRVGVPLVKVPVLSKSTTSTVRICSRARRSLTRTPPRAARSVAIETTSGMASPSACGQAMTSTVMARTTAASGCPSAVQVTAVMMAAASANQNSQPAAVSATR
ncbi:Uncharacterised protein [Mycobacteroides abscessus subsp. abscessus]|nr:Uncharacterised protein [Mycobacteroides abscessus subsp. abscessus]